MIFTDRKITIRNGKSSINEPVILYRGDYEVSIRFTIMESKFRFKSGVNLVDSEKASHGQLAILAPYGGNVFSEIVKCEDGTVTFTLTKEMIDQLEEVGLYSFQIRLFDYYRESRVSIPPVEFGIEVREPVASEDHDNEVNNAIVGYSIAKVVDPSKEDVGDAFNANGQYNKTDWETGDRITEGKLNKIEDALDKINQNEINDVVALNKRITSNFNVLDANKANKNDVFSMANMGQDVKEAMTGGSVAVVGKNAILTENIQNDQVTYAKRTDLGHTFNLSYGAGKLPDFDTTKYTLTIFSDTLIYYGSTKWVTTEDIVIDFLHDNYVSDNIVLWFDTVNKQFKPMYFRYSPDNVEQCIIVCTVKLYTSPYLMSCPFEYTINGMYQDTSKVKDIISTYPIDHCFLYSGGKTQYFVEVNTTDRTLTFPPSGYSLDAGIFIGGKLYPMATKTEGATFDISVPGSTTLGKILFEMSTKTVSVIRYDANFDKTKFYMLGTIRHSGGITVDLCIPYKIDGKIMNLDIVSESQIDAKIKNNYLHPPIISPGNAQSTRKIPDHFPVFDSINYTLTIPRGQGVPTGFMINGVHMDVVLSGTDIVMDLTKTISSSLGKILIKPSTLSTTNFEYKIVNWSATVDMTTWLQIGAIRYGNTPVLYLIWPYMQDGKLYGLNYVTPAELETKLASLDLYPNPKDAYVKSINHRGYISAPENTLAAFIMSKKKGYSYVECDVRFTSDGIPVLLHDADIDRTSNGTGNIADMTFEEVRALDFGSWKSSDYVGEQIPTLDEFLLLCKRLDIHPYIELKAQYNGSYQIIYDTIKKHGFDKKCTILGGGAATAKALPYARLGIITSSISSSLVETAKTYLTGTNEVFLDYQNALVTEANRAVCEEAIAAGIQLEVWNVFTKEQILTNVDLGVTGITNDNLNVAKLMREDFE